MIAALAPTLLLAACALPGPRPDAPVPDAGLPAHFPAAPAEGEAASPRAAALPWQDFILDPTLQGLVRTALENNRDLRLAVLRADEARAGLRIRRAEQVPIVGLSAQQLRAGLPAPADALLGRSVLEGTAITVGTSQWELDLWGRLRATKDAALAQWLATDEGRRAAELALIAQVADAYLGLCELDERLALARRTAASRAESERIFQRRLDVGAGTALELAQVRTLSTQAHALVAQLELAHAHQRDALAFLLGADPGDVPTPPLSQDDALLAEPRPGLPSDLLTDRPDLRAAERLLASRHASVQAARAAFFPRIALTGALGRASTELDDLFDTGHGAWLFRPTLELPLFDGGRRRANLDLATVRQDIAVADYEKAVQSAFRDVADALAAHHWLATQRDVAAAALAAQRQREHLTRLQFDTGAVAHFELLDAERDLLAAEQEWVRTRRALLSSRIALYAALGGGHAYSPSETRPEPTR